MKEKTNIFGVILISFLLVIYLIFALQRAVALFQTGTLVSVSMAVALVILPVIGAWALVRELVFGFQSNKLVRLLEAQNLVPEEEIDTLPSGRPIRDQVKSVLPKYENESLANPLSWQSTARLGIMLDAAGDRTGARKALRDAIKLQNQNDRL